MVQSSTSPWCTVTFGSLLVVASGGTLAGGQLLLSHYSKEITHDGGLGSAVLGGEGIELVN